jgi:hypothetical protein
MWHVWGTGEVYTGFRWGNLEERVHLGDPGTDARIILKRMFRNGNGVECTGFTLLRICRGGVFLWNGVITFGFRKMWEIS